MNWLKILVAAFGAVLFVVAHRTWGWSGVAMVGGAVGMWVLLHFTRLMHVLKRASERPIGRVGSAVMLNARLKRSATLMHVVAQTRSLGELLTPRGEQPERYRWSDNGASSVTADFTGGRLVHWTLQRPAADTADTADASATAPADGPVPNPGATQAPAAAPPGP